MTTLKLSEAIRLGAMLKPQAYGRFYNGYGTCALGAALDASGQLPLCNRDFHARVKRTFGASFWLRARIIWRNDVNRWSREQIADWVETIENQHAGREEQSAKSFTEPQAEESCSLAAPIT